MNGDQATMGKKASRQAERIAAAKLRDAAVNVMAASTGEPLSAIERARLLAQRSQSRRSGQLAMMLALTSSVAL